jgi:hypothetical protein
MFSRSRLFFIEFEYKLHIALAFLFAFGLYIIHLMSYWTFSPPVYLVGTVQTSGPVSVSRLAGGTAEVASVKLADGRVVFAGVAQPSGPLKPGDQVKVIERDFWFSPPAYGVISKVR